MTTVPAPSLVIPREEWPDADFDLPDDVPLTASSDREDDVEDWDAEMDLQPAGGAKAKAVIAGIAVQSEALTISYASKSQSSSTFTIRPPIASSTEEEDEDDEGVSTIKASAIPQMPSQTPPPSTTDEDFEDAFSLPSDLTQLSLAPLSLQHRSSKNSLEWGDKDQTSSSQSSDAYSTLGFSHASPSSNSLSSVTTPGTETDEDEDQSELEGLVIPLAIFESGHGGKHLSKVLELKKKAQYSAAQVKVSSPNPEDDFEAGLVLDDDTDLSPSRLLQNAQSQKSQRQFNRSSSAPLQRPSASLRPPSRLKSDRVKSPSNPPQSSVRQLQKLRLSPSPPLLPPSKNYQPFSASPASPSPPALLTAKPGNLRGQKSHTGLKPPTPPATRKLVRKASLSSLIETSHAHATGNDSGASRSRTVARYEEPTAASLAKTHKSSSTRLPERPVPPTRPSTPSANTAALRLTMPTQMRSKSRPSLSQVFGAPPTSGNPQRVTSPLPPLPRPPSSLSLKPRTTKTTQPANPPLGSPVTPPAPKVLRRPKRQKLYGDGTELDGFEDLPTDRDKESRYRVQPKGYGNRVPGASYASKAAALPSTLPTDGKGTIRRRKREGSIGNESLAAPTNTLRRTTSRIDSLSRFPPSEPLPKKRRNVTSPSSQTKRKPTLIRNLGSINAPKVIGDMRWNPQTLRWEGNDQILKDFDAVVGTSTRPALITHLTGSSMGSPVGSFASGARRVGDMIFDPQRMCWISTLPPEEDEPDVFANLADDEDENDWDSKAATIRASVQQTPSETGSANTCTTVSTSTDARLSPPSPARSRARTISDSESDRGSRASLMVCDIDDTFIASCRAAEERHRQEMKGWRSIMGRQDISSEPDRSYLFEIRALATRRY